MATYLLIVGGAYYLITGIWPLVSMRTFEAVTGPKRDHWLVKTVGVLAGVIGAVLLLAGTRGAVYLEIALLAVGAAVGFCIIDVIFVSQRRIPRIYLLDALAEALFLALWLLAWPAVT